MSKMLSYRAHAAITKAAFVAEMEAHAAADRLIPGTYWDLEESRGCAVGCGVQSLMNLMGFKYRHSDHDGLANVLGIPRWLVYVEDIIFEQFVDEEQKQWPVQFARAIPDGADLSGAWKEFVLWILKNMALPAAGTNSEVRQVIGRVIAGIETNWAADNAISAELQAAAVASDTANNAFYTAANAAYAAANAARAAAYGSNNGYAAICASNAVTACDKYSGIKQMADKLLEILASTPTVVDIAREVSNADTVTSHA